MTFFNVKQSAAPVPPLLRSELSKTRRSTDANKRLWLLTDIPIAPTNVRFWR